MRTVAVAVVSLAVGVAVGVAFGPTRTQTEYQTVVQQTVMPAMGSAVTWEEAQAWQTPISDSLVDWEQVERETDCLWEFLQDHFGRDITLDRVLAAGYWTGELGGACALTGDTDG